GDVEVAGAVALDAGLHVVGDAERIGRVVDHGLGVAVGRGIAAAAGGAGRERGGVEAAAVGGVAGGGLAAGSVEAAHQWRSSADAGVADVARGARIAVVTGDVVGRGVATGARAVAGVRGAGVVVIALIGRATGVREEREARRLAVEAGGGILNCVQ